MIIFTKDGNEFLILLILLLFLLMINKFWRYIRCIARNVAVN